MDGLNETQQEILDLASGVFANLVAESDGANIDQLWQRLADTDILGLAVPEDLGGSGNGLRELSLVLYAAGRHGVVVPIWSTLVCAGLSLANFGRPGSNDMLEGIAKGSERFTAALSEGALGEWMTPLARASEGESGWSVSGVKTFVYDTEWANRALVSAVGLDGAPLLAVVDLSSPGIETEIAWGTDKRATSSLSLDNVAIKTTIGPESPETNVLDWCTDRAIVGLCAFHAGVAAGALELSATYLREREQFGRPLGAFQAVAMRAADAFIDTESMWNTTMEAITALEIGHPDSNQAIAVAKIWSGKAGARVLGSLQHLHGGIGVDTSYPLHRYFLLSKRLQLSLGSTSWHMELLGHMLVDQ